MGSDPKEGRAGTLAVTQPATAMAVGQPVTLRTKANFAGQHLRAAAMFARMSGQLETSNAGGSSADPFFPEIVGYVTGAILTAASALEAYINQVFIDGDVFPTSDVAGTTQELWDIWWREIERRPVLKKYKLALELRQQSPITDNAAKLLIDIRNALVHFKPQWADESKSHQELTNRLSNQGVSSSLFGSSTPLFPHDFMSHDMARWAAKTAWNFIEAFSRQSGIPNKYSHMVNDLNPGYPTWPVP